MSFQKNSQVLFKNVLDEAVKMTPYYISSSEYTFKKICVTEWEIFIQHSVNTNSSACLEEKPLSCEPN